MYEDAAHSARRMLVLDPRSGAVPGIEDTVTKDDPEYGVAGGRDVVQRVDAFSGRSPVSKPETL